MPETWSRASDDPADREGPVAGVDLVRFVLFGDRAYAAFSALID